MKKIVLHIVFLALIAHTCEAAIILQTPYQERIDRVYEATIDALVKCYMDGTNALGIVGDSGGFIKALWTKHAIPAVLIDAARTTDRRPSDRDRRKLVVFVIFASTWREFEASIDHLATSIWWNHNARYLILSPTPDKLLPLSDVAPILHTAYDLHGVLNAQLIQSGRYKSVRIIDYNPYTRKAPEPWELIGIYRTIPRPIYLFAQLYRRGEQTCEALNFRKTTDIGGYPIEFMTIDSWGFCKLTKKCTVSFETFNVTKEFEKILIPQYQWFIDNIVLAMNATAVIKKGEETSYDISILNSLYTDGALSGFADLMIHSFIETPVFALTQHTGHMTQLEKILSVIDKDSQIGMYVVYLITLLFFKFFMRQSLMPAILNLVRLTCNTGLPKLPTNVAPTIYLACLFMFVITLQAIYTGNLASLLTTTIAYPHVNKKEDISKLGYTVYTKDIHYHNIASDPALVGRVINIGNNVSCEDYVLRDPLATCITAEAETVIYAIQHKLHISRDPIQMDYSYHKMPHNNPLHCRIQEIILTWHESGLGRFDHDYERIRNGLVDDDEVNKNTVRRVMNLGDLRFAFVILGIGLMGSLICFIAEILISYIRKTLAKRRNRVRPLLALTVAKKNVHGFRH